MKRKFAYLVFLLFVSLSMYSQDIYQWRGEERDGKYSGKNLLKTWPANGPELLWFSDIIGDGYGAPTVSTDRIYVNGEIDSISHIFAFDLSGKLIWKTPNGKEFTGNGFSSKFAGSRSALTIFGDLIYACSGNGRIVCLDKQTGKEKWSTEMVAGLNGMMPVFGYSESLLVDEKNVYCLPGGVNSNIAAVDRFNGKMIWTSKALSDTASYNSPLLIKLPARSILVTFSAFNLMGIDAGTGELLWSQKQEKVVYKQQCNTPIFENGFIYYVAGDGNGAVKLELSADGKSIKQVWRNQNIQNNFNGFVKINTAYPLRSFSFFIISFNVLGDVATAC